MNKIPQILKRQVDELFSDLKVTGDEYTIIFYRGDKPIFANFENLMGGNDVAFFRDIGNIIFYGIEYVPSLKYYIEEKVYNELVQMGMDENEKFHLYTFSVPRDKDYRDAFYEFLESEK